ncbi:zinc transporter ZupT [Posidoniimonas polymericola]|uniref:Zinc transporter ZupT n=1 Tax=Posidoniimonas polymericola TaxID=2528002 RepID=A0A5C5YRC6_9BACT|nr:divalent cation transporter [Posidoniimonas polymericola]TWT77429.1 zinc transporter ZupT [Posidoniimonas polymericola]
MSTWLEVVLLTLMAGAAMPIGAAIAMVERIHPQWLENELRHTVIAFGGGALLSAVALVLVPEGSRDLHPAGVAVCFAGGGVAFMALDLLLFKINTPATQLAAMLSDFIPEAMALGASFALGENTGPLLAGLIALQNLPEGFNSYRELVDSTDWQGRRLVAAFAAMALVGPAAGMVGYHLLSDSPRVVSGVMLFAAGGILYLTFQDIAPQARLENRWAPSLGAVAGFLLGLIGEMLVSA